MTLLDSLGAATQTAAAAILGFFGLAMWNHHGRLATLEAESRHRLDLIKETREEVGEIRRHLLGPKPGE